MLLDILLWVGLVAFFLGGLYVNPKWKERNDA